MPFYDFSVESTSFLTVRFVFMISFQVRVLFSCKCSNIILFSGHRRCFKKLNVISQSNILNFMTFYDFSVESMTILSLNQNCCGFTSKSLKIMIFNRIKGHFCYENLKFKEFHIIDAAENCISRILPVVRIKSPLTNTFSRLFWLSPCILYIHVAPFIVECHYNSLSSSVVW